MLPLIQAFIYGSIASFAFSLCFDLRGFTLLSASLGGGFSWFLYQLAGNLSRSYILPYFIATVLASVYAELMARICKKPATVYLIVAMLPLVPGQSIYDTMYAFTHGETSRAFELATKTFAISGTLAMGMLVTSTVFRLLQIALKNSAQRL